MQNDSHYLNALQPDRFPSPCFVTDTSRLRHNVAILDGVQRQSGAKILLALKAFSQWGLFPLLSRQGTGSLYGCCASSPDEARLAREEFGGEVHAFAAAWSRDELAETLRYADHIVFNSFRQWREMGPMLAEAGRQRGTTIQAGLRLNPEHSEGAVPIYDPCDKGSRLGIREAAFHREMETLGQEGFDLDGLSGFHFHTLCEQNADALDRTLDAVEQKFGGYFPGREWINFGGGHHITRPDYDRDLLIACVKRIQERYKVQVYLEPGEAVALNAGLFISTVLDVVEADMPVVIMDSSAACHMPDVLEMPYRPMIIGSGQPGEKSWTCRLGGKSCLAGDVMGEYSFNHPLQPGERLVFTDMAIYSMVKTNTFNGLRLPGIAVWDPDKDSITISRSFGYEDFKTRLS